MKRRYVCRTAKKGVFFYPHLIQEMQSTLLSSTGSHFFVVAVMLTRSLLKTMQQIIKKYVRHNRSSHLPGSIMCQAVSMQPSDCEYTYLHFLDSKLSWLNLTHTSRGVGIWAQTDCTGTYHDPLR